MLVVMDLKITFLDYMLKNTMRFTMSHFIEHLCLFTIWSDRLNKRSEATDVVLIERQRRLAKLANIGNIF